MLNSKIRPRAVVGYGVKIFHPSPPNYVTRSSGYLSIMVFDIFCISIRGNKDTQAIPVDNEETKFRLLSDDLTGFVRKNHSFKQL